MSSNKIKYNNYDLNDLENEITMENQISNFHTMNPKKSKNEKDIQKNMKSIDELLNINKKDPNELPPVNNFNDYDISRTQSKYINNLKKQVNDLNTELNKMRNDKDVENYKILENNYLKKNKEMSQLIQDNNKLLFQIEDLSRKFKDKNNLTIPNNNNSSKGKNSIKKKLNKLKENKQNNLARIYGANPNISILSNTKNTARSLFMEGIENNNKNHELINKLKNELELYKSVDDENKKLKNQIEEKETIVNKYKIKIQSLEFENKNIKNENNKNKEKYTKLFSDYSDLEKIYNDHEKKHNNLKSQMKNNLFEKKKIR